MVLKTNLRFTLLLAGSLWLAFIGRVQAQEDSRKGELSGQGRTYYQSTHNQGELQDFYALATGGKLHYQYRFHPRISVGASLYATANLGIQDLTSSDATTGQRSRYERALFNLQDAEDRLLIHAGELYVQYQRDKHQAKLGRMLVESPFLNPQDGRMIPTLSQGLWYRYTPGFPFKLQLGVLNAIAPRGTARFYGIGESIGKHSVGSNPDGTLSRYAGHTRSDYIALANLEVHPTNAVKLELWDYYVNNVFHSLYLKPTFRLGSDKTELALEWLHQDRVGSGGNKTDSLRYFSNAHSNVLGAELAVRLPHARLAFGYDHVLPGGRFLFPREWGRESFFTVQKRERSEGTANNHGVLLTYERLFRWKTHQLHTITTLGHQWRPPVSHPADNKYGIPDYTHLNLDLFYQANPSARLKPELLLSYKVGRGDELENLATVINKVNMLQVNVIINYDF